MPKKISAVQKAIETKDLAKLKLEIQKILQKDLSPEERGAFYSALTESYLDATVQADNEYKEVLKNALSAIQAVNQFEKESVDKIAVAQARHDILSMFNEPEGKNILDEIKGQVRKLIWLIQASTLEDEFKQSLITIIPELSIDQVDSIINSLEEKYLDEATANIDKDFQAKLAKLVNQTNEAETKSSNELVKNINSLSQVIS